MPAASAIASSRRSSARPAAFISPNPALITIAARAPLRASASRAVRTLGAGMAIRASSGAAGSS
ncbi:MAG: hypothetical protein MUF46_09130, partial [Desulfobacterales bacterium]|nr:hypothetical protein [Desulfobacterales bacterium]